MRILGVNAVFHDPAAALVVDGRIVAAAEEERFSRRKHGKDPVPFSTWELRSRRCAGAWRSAACASRTSTRWRTPTTPPWRGPPRTPRTSPADEWEGLRTLFVERAPRFLQTSLPAWTRRRSASSATTSPTLRPPTPPRASTRAASWSSTVRGEAARICRGAPVGGRFEPLASTALPHSLGLLYEELTAHLGFRRSSDEYKVMAMASYGKPAFLDALREAVRADGAGGFVVDPVDFSAFAPRLAPGEAWTPAHADLAHSVQKRVEEMLVELATWLHGRTGDRELVMAGGVALNCVANSRIWEESPFERVWVQPAAGDSGTALGAALYVARELGDTIEPMATAALGRGFSDAEIEPGCERPGSSTSAPTTCRRRSPRCSPPTVWSRGSRAARSSGRAPWATGRCSPTRGR
jgi:carbamoyltransferase